MTSLLSRSRMTKPSDGAPSADQDHALRAFGHDPLEMTMRGADRELAVDQRLLVILGVGGGGG